MKILYIILYSELFNRNYITRLPVLENCQ